MILFGVALMPQSMNLPANILVSFVCALQVQTFRKVNGNAYATTMCIGNMRSAVECLCAAVHTKDKTLLIKSAQYFAVILIFGAGAGAGRVITRIYAEKAIFVCCALLLLGFAIMFIKSDSDR